MLNFTANEMVYLLLESRTCIQSSSVLVDFDVFFVLLMMSCILLTIDGPSEAIYVISVSAHIFGTFIAFFWH